MKKLSEGRCPRDFTTSSRVENKAGVAAVKVSDRDRSKRRYRTYIVRGGLERERPQACGGFMNYSMIDILGRGKNKSIFSSPTLLCWQSSVLVSDPCLNSLSSHTHKHDYARQTQRSENTRLTSGIRRTTYRTPEQNSQAIASAVAGVARAVHSPPPTTRDLLPPAAAAAAAEAAAALLQSP